ncbi:DUF1343 domain-containing protein [Mesotoga infera]|uniref:DUF1343 domain-containing protein n=1 Tax=Mesotoga infera TaxID=1236046 RepID=UPI001E42B769|nr:DUF1343 domain-containing protein [Mesotoga infera]
MSFLVLQGIDVLSRRDFADLKDMSIGLVTNYSFIDNSLRCGIDMMFKSGLKVRKIFTPEHGLGGIADGVVYDDSIHPRYNVPVVSLYGSKRKPRAEDLDGLDILVYDIQDVGLRYYTFIYTLAFTMESAAESGKRYMVLDRVNPLGRGVFGSRIDNDLQTFVGGYRLPLQYGLTSGELAIYLKKLNRLDLDLRVVPAEGWKGETFDETSLVWNVPSPNIPTFDSLLGYAGTCFFEGTNVSEGRGTFKPFLVIGAPWIDGFDMAEKIKEDFPSVKVRRREFMPFYRKYANASCDGIEFFPSKSDNFFLLTLSIMEYLLKYEKFEISDRLDDLMGVKESARKIRSGSLKPDQWKSSGEEFIEFAQDCLIHPGRLFYR